MNRTDRRHLTGGVSHVALLAASTLLAWAVAQPAAAQSVPAKPAAGATTETLPAISVEGTTEQEPNTLSAPTGISRLPGTAQDTPQIINVVPAETLRDQGVTTLDQALRNVPGITVSIGEGGGGYNGDQFKIRGLDAKNDIYIDGLRDFGVYTRDSFNYESVEVLKGPSGTTFGRGTTGGLINSSTKTPLLDTFYRVSGSIGTGIHARGTADLNYQLSDTIAVRLNLMRQYSETVDRDEIKSDRWGIAPSIAFGLGTNTQLTLDYMHFEDDRVPDYGIPVILGRPAHIDRSNFYGTDTDADDADIDRLTARFSHRFDEHLTFYNDMRLGFYDRYFAPTAAGCNAACVAAYTDFKNGVPGANPQITRGGPGPLLQDGWGVQNVTSILADIELGLKQQIVAGIDISYEEEDRKLLAYSLNGVGSAQRPGTGLLDPVLDPGVPIFVLPGATGSTNARRESDSTEYGLFVSDRVWLTEQFSILGGLRYGHYQANYATRAVNASTDDDFKAGDHFWDPKLSLIFEPTPSYTFYASWAKSTTPPGNSVANTNAPLATNNQDTAPEKNESFEIGAKLNFFEDRLGVIAAAFHIEKGNARQTDPNNDALTVNSGEKQRIRGIELGVTGRVSDQWQIYGGYTYLESKIKETSLTSNPVPPALPPVSTVGNRVQQVPKHAFTAWTDYRPFEGLQLGLGAVYRSQVYLDSINENQVPHNLSIDGLVAYRLEPFRLAVNGYNLFDRVNYEGLRGNRVSPSAGRTVIFTTEVEF